MRGFDYLIVLFSVLLGLSLSRLLVGLARVVSSVVVALAIWTRNRIYHAAIVVALLVVLARSVIRLLPSIG